MTYFLGVAFLCLAVVPGSLSNNDIHEYMSREERQQVFQTNDGSVLEYEITKIHLSERFHKTDLVGRRMHLRAFGDSINIWLHPTESVLVGDKTPIYYTRSSRDKPQGVEFRKWDIMSNLGEILEYPQYMASLVIGTEASGRTTVNGHIASKRLAMRSMPTRVAEEYRRRRRSAGHSDDLDSGDSDYHIVYKTDKSYLDNYPELPVNTEKLQKRAAQNATTIPDTLYPEILVVVEHSLYKSFKNDVYGLLQYLLAFVNGIDLKYRSLESPRYRFHISGIVLAMKPEDTPYIFKNAIDANTFNYNLSMYYAAAFFRDVQVTFPLNSYDISVTLTKKAFGVDDKAGTLGASFEAGACQNYTDEPFHNVAIVKDNGAFGGIIAAAYELGHLFGARHDDYNACKTQTGFPMNSSTNSSDFSPCAIERFDTYLKANLMDCLYNVPTVPGKTLPKLMPGRMKSLEKQCKALDLLEPCQKENVDHDVCTNIYCLNEKGECRETGIGALDGTSCEDDGKFCLHMRCVKL